MGGRGGSFGGSQGTRQIARAPAAANGRYDVRSLAAMSDQQLTATLNDIFANTAVDSNQQNTDT